MKTQYGFTRFDNIEEFETWLNKQSKYNYTGIQVHHTWLPDYSCFYKKDGSHEDELTRQYNTKDFHVNTNHWGNIAQHFTIFPNGKIVTGRSLASTTPIGIKGWNTNHICIEIYGNFDKGKDVMKQEQKAAVIACYALLAKKFNISIDNSHIRPHCWFTASGTYLGCYNSSRSAKTCPGTNFWGYGCNTKDTFQHFLNDVKAYKKDVPAATTTASNKTKLVKNISNTGINIRAVADWNAKAIGTLKAGDSLTYVETVTAANGTTKMYKTKLGTYVTASTKYTKLIEI